MSASAAAAAEASVPRRRHSRWRASAEDHHHADSSLPGEASGGSSRSSGGSDDDVRRGGARRRPVRSGFARIAESLVDVPLITPEPQPLFEVALKKAQAEFFRVVRVRGDGRCMFRALALGLAHIKKDVMTASMEEQEADQLRLAVAESMCRSPEKRKQFEDAVTAISFEMPIGTYCKRILSPNFWGGEPELLVLAQILRRPIMVYIPAAKVKSAGTKSGYVCIQTYGRDFEKGGKLDKSGKGKKPVRLLYNGENHYDLLL